MHSLRKSGSRRHTASARRYRIGFWLFGLCWWLIAPARLWPESPPAALLADGYNEMYNLNFSAAHDDFRQWQHAHPQDPLAPASDAAAYLFSELDRLHLLESELFSDDSAFEHRPKPVPDERTKAAFETALDQAERLSSAALKRSPRDNDALFAEVLANGLRGNYQALIEKRDLAALRYMKRSRSVAEELLAADPAYYDAYLAMGAENYLLGLHSAPVRWLLRMGGAETDTARGLTELRMVAEKGRYLGPYARLLLVVAALREKDPDHAATLLEGLAREFPHNPLYRKELARINSN
jgi:hypothetical protein